MSTEGELAEQLEALMDLRAIYAEWGIDEDSPGAECKKVVDGYARELFGGTHEREGTSNIG